MMMNKVSRKDAKGNEGAKRRIFLCGSCFTFAPLREKDLEFT